MNAKLIHRNLRLRRGFRSCFKIPNPERFKMSKVIARIWITFGFRDQMEP